MGQGYQVRRNSEKLKDANKPVNGKTLGLWD
jgi:hypothetical protein